MRYTPIVAATLMLVSRFSCAEALDLVCTDKSGFSINFQIDTSRNLVTANGTDALKVSIDKHSITFFLVVDNQEWFHSINRSTGNMTVQSPDQNILPTYACEKAKLKF